MDPSPHSFIHWIGLSQLVGHIRQHVKEILHGLCDLLLAGEEHLLVASCRRLVHRLYRFLEVLDELFALLVLLGVQTLGYEAHVVALFVHGPQKIPEPLPLVRCDVVSPRTQSRAHLLPPEFGFDKSVPLQCASRKRVPAVHIRIRTHRLHLPQKCRSDPVDRCVGGGKRKRDGGDKQQDRQNKGKQGGERRPRSVRAIWWLSTEHSPHRVSCVSAWEGQGRNERWYCC
mmetsp:Transcript_37559/g.94222  ORF Transcript_37559/g.94222 Transcript_37559/m.94222 type:complete len:229 (-) Transcript_37559:119-805(-)